MNSLHRKSIKRFFIVYILAMPFSFGFLLNFQLVFADDLESTEITNDENLVFSQTIDVENNFKIDEGVSADNPGGSSITSEDKNVNINIKTATANTENTSFEEESIQKSEYIKSEIEEDFGIKVNESIPNANIAGENALNIKTVSKDPEAKFIYIKKTTDSFPIVVPITNNKSVDLGSIGGIHDSKKDQNKNNAQEITSQGANPAPFNVLKRLDTKYFTNDVFNNKSFDKIIGVVYFWIIAVSVFMFYLLKTHNRRSPRGDGVLIGLKPRYT